MPGPADLGAAAHTSARSGRAHVERVPLVAHGGCCLEISHHGINMAARRVRSARLSQSRRGVVEPFRECETASRKGTDGAYFFSGLRMKTALHRGSGGRDLKIDRDFDDCFD